MNPEVQQIALGLPAKYPYQFERCRLGVDMTPGWTPIFAKLCEDVDQLLGEDKRGFSWVQVKEKWGAARFYFELAGLAPDKRVDLQSPDGARSLILKPEDEGQRSPEIQQLTHKLRNLILAAEKATQHTCAMCGKPGELDRGRGHFLTLCSEHAALRKEHGSLGEELWIVVQHGKWSAGRPTNLPGKKGAKSPAPNLAAARRAAIKKSDDKAYAAYMLDHFGYQFAGSQIRVASGWKRVFFDLCDRIDKELGDDKRGFRWSQIGEQFGAASFHFELGEGVPAEVASELIRKLRAIVAEAEDKTRQMCIVCAEPGQLDQSEPHVLVLCPKHAGGARSALEWLEIQKGYA